MPRSESLVVPRSHPSPYYRLTGEERLRILNDLGPGRLRVLFELRSTV